MKSISAKRLIQFFGSSTFFWLIVGTFVLQATWIALSARYPQAFDEQFHFGLIQIYSHHLSPFLNHQPADAAQYGAVFRDPSYLYHYLLSFPYRLITHLTASQTAQIIVLRLINVGFLASSLLIFRKVLRLTPVPKAAANVVLAFVVLLPVFPLLGSQINYDNLLVPLTGLAVYWSLQFIQQVRTEKIWRWDKLIQLFVLCLLTSLVKYPFLPIFAALGLYILIVWLRARKHKLEYSFAAAGHLKVRALLYALVLLVSLGLFMQRDGSNILKYHTPIPECNQVLNVEACQAYGPWARNYRFVGYHIQLSPHDIWTFPLTWIKHLVWELMFTLTSNFNPDGTVAYHAGQNFIAVQLIIWSVLIVGAVAVLFNFKILWGHPALRLYMVVSAVYILTLFVQNFHDYLHVGVAFAIHGRYLFPVLPLLLVTVAWACSLSLRRLHLRASAAQTMKAGVTTVLLILLLIEGGGFVTYILRSDSSWFWPQSKAVQTINWRAQNILRPLVWDVQKP